MGASALAASSSSASQGSSSALERGQPDGALASSAHNVLPSSPAPPRFVTLSELTDFRAMQRTFDLAYSRTALGELSFAVLVLKVFQPRFQVIGLLYTLLCLGHVFVAAWRRKLAVGNDRHWANLQIVSHSTTATNTTTTVPALVTQEVALATDDDEYQEPLVEVSTEELNEAIAQDKITILAAPRERDGDGEGNEDGATDNTGHSDAEQDVQRGSSRSAEQSSVNASTTSHQAGDLGEAKTLVRIFNRDFRTAGHVIAIITVFTVSLQLAILFSLYTM